MKKIIWSKLILLSLPNLILLATAAHANETPSFTHTSAQLTREHLTLELEVLPHMLQKAQVLRDLDDNGQMSREEFDHAKAGILNYVQEHISVTLNARVLRADSAAVLYRIAKAAAAPSRIYITCWYALLLKPEHLRLDNRMFSQFAETHKNYGTITHGNQTVDFEFPLVARSEHDGVEFALTAGNVMLLHSGTTLYSPALIWFAAGGGGLVLLGLLAYFRKLARCRTRHQKRTHRATTTAVSRVSHRQDYELEQALN